MPNTAYPALTPGPTYNDGRPEKVGVFFQVNAPVTVAGIYFYSPSAGTGRSFELFGGDSRLAVATSDVATGDNYVALPAPVALAPGVNYLAAVGYYGSAPHLDYTATPFAAGATQGPFVFPAQSGRYEETTDSLAIPTGFTNSWYGVGPYVATVEDLPVAVTIANLAPAVEGVARTLVATTTNETGTVDYEWSQVSGPAATFTDANEPTLVVTPSVSGAYVFRVDVIDDNSTAFDLVTVVATEPLEPQFEYRLMAKDELGEWHYAGTGEPVAPPETHPGVFYPEDYGAIGDGVTDDTDAWNACIAAAVAAAPAHNYSVVVEAQSAEYLIASAPVAGWQYGNAQISIPHVPASTSRKVTLTIRGRSVASSFLHWEQVAPQSIGTVLHSTFTSGSYNATWGVPSVLGGPTNLATAPQDEFATVSNMQIVVDGVSTLQPAGASLIGFDFRRIGQAHIVSASSFSTRTRQTTPSIETLVTNDQSIGLAMPLKGNNARSEIGSYTAEGLYTGLIVGEHLVATYIGVIYCRRGIQIVGLTGGNWPDGQPRTADHSIWIGRYLAEAVDYWIYNDGTGTQLVIGSMGGEGTTNFVAHVYDQISGGGGNGGLTGEVRLLDIFRQFAVVEGNSPLRIVNDGVPPGPAYANPAVPASTVAIRNPFYRDAVVSITGGTVTDVRLDGVSLGTSRVVVVPTGRRISITYSAAPTWAWVLS